jgi:SH3 domain-containing YSC84-like protein 1
MIMRFSSLYDKWLWAGILALCMPLCVAAQEAAVPVEVQQQVETATQVFDSLLRVELPPHQRAFLNEALKDAHGFAVFPNTLRVGMGVSTIQGRGVLAYRHEDGEWSPPIPLLVQGISTGPHFGAIYYDTLVVIKTPAAMQRILSGQQRLQGTEATGPLQQSVSPERDIVSYSRTRGLSVGLTVDDIHIMLNQQAIAALYGRTVEPREILSGQKIGLRRPVCAQKFIESANTLAGKSPTTTYWK